MKSKIFILTAWLTITGSLLAQNPAQEYKTRMDHIFMYMDKSRITTGLQTDSNYTILTLKKIVL